MPTVSHRLLRNLTFNIFKSAGVPHGEARVISDHLVEGDMCGHNTHGIWRVKRYIEDVKKGYIPWSARKILRESKAVSVIDGCGGNGIVALTHAADMAITKGQNTTFGAVGIHGVTHAGRLGEFAARIADQDMVGMILSNAAGIFVAPFGSGQRKLGPNPQAFAVPRFVGSPIVLDMSMSVVAGTAVRQKMENGEPVPKGWLVDHDGNYVTDSQRYDDSDVAILPLGGLQFGYKGHGMSMMFEMIAGPLSQAGVTTGIGETQGEGLGKGGGGFLVIAIDISAFTDVEIYKKLVEDYIKWVKSAIPFPTVKKLYVAGEISQETRARSLRSGVKIPETTWVNLKSVAKDLDVCFPEINATDQNLEAREPE